MKDEKIIKISIPASEYGKLATLAAMAKMPIDTYAATETLTPSNPKPTTEK